jgi:threonine dehydrogenase-like Zn-dependent dehydrogenase
VQAVVLEEYGRMVLSQIPVPTPGAELAVVRVCACGICGSDLEGYVGNPGMRSRRVPPLVMGHEFAGIVEAGPAQWVRRAVAVNPLISCGRCQICARGAVHLCPARRLIGLNHPGAFAEQVAVPVGQLYPLPRGMPVWRGALVEPLAVAVHAVDLPGPDLPDRALVLGGGAIGYLVAWVLASRSVAATVVEIHAGRRDTLRGLGVTAASEAVEEVPLVFDTVGTMQTRRHALDHLAPGGTAVMLGLHEDSCALPFYPLILGERMLQGAYTYRPDDFRRALGLVGRLPEALVDRRPLAAGPEVFAEMARGGIDRLKVLLEPAGGVHHPAGDGG